jgi:hypothetical protein
MSGFAEVEIGELFKAQGGRPTFIRDYLDRHPGAHPVYSASLARPFGYVDTFDYEGPYLSWVMNGYGGRVQEICGRFSATRDRGVLLPRQGVRVPDLTYLRFAMEPQLMAAAVGRRVDGRLNEYTKIYAETAESVRITLPRTKTGNWDYERMEAVGERLRRIEEAQRNVRLAQEALTKATFGIEIDGSARTLNLGETEYFRLMIGDRVLRKDQVSSGIPVYSANALVPFGAVARSNLTDFSRPSLLWGIDGVFGWNCIPAEEPFATTDHCGRLQIVDDRLSVDYVYAYLKATRGRYGFDRVFRASLRNMREDVTVAVPLDENGEPSLSRQRALAKEYWARSQAQTSALSALADVLNARMTAEL